MLVITRKSAFYANYLRSYKIFIDHECVGKIRVGQEKRFELNEGVHTVWFAIDWCRSKEISFEIRSQDDLVEIECWATSPFTVPFDIFFRTMDYMPVAIKRQDRPQSGDCAEYRSVPGSLGVGGVPPSPPPFE